MNGLKTVEILVSNSDFQQEGRVEFRGELKIDSSPGSCSILGTASVPTCYFKRRSTSEGWEFCYEWWIPAAKSETVERLKRKCLEKDRAIWSEAGHCPLNEHRFASAIQYLTKEDIKHRGASGKVGDIKFIMYRYGEHSRTQIMRNSFRDAALTIRSSSWCWGPKSYPIIYPPAPIANPNRARGPRSGTRPLTTTPQ